MPIVRKQKHLPPAMIGTAGHVDHGKTALVKHLTGYDTDRLKAEKERGLTIDLGFAPCALSGDRMIGIVDVPGHIDFIRNMVTGAASIDLLILVVAADDGVMPQTSEHLQIIKMLSVPRLVVALTKIDLVDQEMVELAKDEIIGFLDAMGFPDTPIIPVSNITREGIPELKEAIETAVGELEFKEDPRLFRMNIQKHFSVKGIGTVATGIPISGTLDLNDPLTLLPAGKSTSVRSIQNYKFQTGHTQAGLCCAVNIRDIEEDELERGMALVAPGAYAPTRSAIVTVANNSQEFTLKHKYVLRFHAGTAETNAKVSLIEGNLLGPGEAGFAQLTFDSPVILAAGDTFILRESSPSMTIGGGRVILPEHCRFKRSSTDFHTRLSDAADYLDTRDFTAAQLLVTETPVLDADAISTYSCLGPALAKQALTQKIETGFLTDLGEDTYLVTSRSGEMVGRITRRLQKYHDSHACSWGMEPSALGQALDLKPKTAAALARLLAKNFPELRFSHGRLSLQTFSPAISDQQIRQKDSMLGRIKEAGPECVPHGTLTNELTMSAKECRLLINILVEEGEIVVLGKHYMARPCFDTCVDTFRELAAGGRIVSLNDFRDRLGTGRNITVAILEKFDSLGISRREAEGRRERTG